MAYLLRILALLFGLSDLAAADLPARTICSATLYGQLHMHQCLTLFGTFADRSDNQLRIFDEEQLREVEGRSWPGIINPFRTQVVQVPRFWTSLGCNIALMSFARAPSLNDTSAANEVSGTGVTSWTRIVEGVNDVIEKCVVRERTGGAVTLLSALLPPRPILTVSVWRTDAYFDTIWNDYQTHPHGVRPVDPRDLSGNETTVLQDSGISTSNITAT